MTQKEQQGRMKETGSIPFERATGQKRPIENRIDAIARLCLLYFLSFSVENVPKFQLLSLQSMSSVLKPSPTASQNPPVPPQLNKPMHPQQGPPQSYGQPSNHHSIVSHGNPTAAHNHPQPNHFSLNVPNSFTQPIPMASNHPVPNNPSQPAQQMYSGAKNMSYQGGYQPNLGHAQNQSSNQLPPVTQSLPATNAQSGPQATSDSDKSQSNGTSEEKSNHAQENHVTTPSKETTVTPALPSQPQRVPELEGATASDSAEGQKTAGVAENQQKANDAGESSSGCVPMETEEKEGESSVPSEEKTEEAEEDEDSKGEEEDEEEETAGGDEKSGEDKKEPSVAESDSANTPNDSEKAASESVETEVKEKSTPKRAPPRKRATKSEEEPKPSKSDHKPSTSQKSPSTSKSKRARIRTQPYQSPLPELEIITKITASQRNKTNDEKLIVFFKNEFLAVRNPEGSFYICQAVQNIYKSSAKIRIRWLSLDKNDKTNQIYIPDFYDHTDFDCILTNLNLERIEKGKFRLPPAEKERTDSILKRSLAAEKGEEIPSPTVNEEHPDGLDLSLYKDENQLNKRKTKKRRATSPLKSTRNSSRSPDKLSPEKAKVAKTAPKSNRKETPKKKEAPPAAAKKLPVSTPVSKKSGGSSSRMERAKRRSDTVNSTKVSPVSPKVDHKKAKALAKVARKSAVQAPKVQTPVKKDTKPAATAAATKSTKTTAKVATTSAKKKTPKRSASKK